MAHSSRQRLLRNQLCRLIYLASSALIGQIAFQQTSTVPLSYGVKTTAKQHDNLGRLMDRGREKRKREVNGATLKTNTLTMRVTMTPDLPWRGGFTRSLFQIMARQIKPGDVFEFQTGKGYVQFQATHYREKYGDVVRILDGFTEKPSPVAPERLAAKGPLFVFLYFTPEWRKKLVVKLGNHPIPEHSQKFPHFRLMGIPNPSGPVTRWRLWDGETEYYKGELSADQLKIPPLECMGINILRIRLEKGWLPELDLADGRGRQFNK